MALAVEPEASDELLNVLKRRLPSSLPLLRRLEFAKCNQPGSTGGLRSARVIWVADTSKSKFTAAYVDYAGGPETQMYIYSTLEDEPPESSPDGIYAEQLNTLVVEVDRLVVEYGKPLCYPHGLLLGSLHTRLRLVLESLDRVEGRKTGYYDKWLFRAEDVPAVDGELPDGMSTGTATFEDCKVVVSRTDVPRTAETLMTLPNQIIRLQDGTPIAWAFISYDGSLMSLHCEPPYRRRGLATAIGSRLLKQFTDDGWSAADVAADNEGSRAMCKRLNGSIFWEVSCKNESTHVVAVGNLSSLSTAIPRLVPEPPLLVGLLSPTTLSHICRKWRQIALATPRLWRATKLTPPYALPSEKGVASIVSLWMERSARTPLSIVANQLPHVIPLFLPHRSRWEHLDLIFNTGRHIQTLHMDGAMPLLRSLTLTVRAAVATPLRLLKLPLLRTVVINDRGSPSLALPWSQLTSLTLRNTFPGDCLSILRETSQLVECTLQLWHQATPLGSGDIVMPRLESLVFEPDGEGHREFLESLVTPALRRLEVSEDFLCPDPVRSLKAFIYKSGCVLQSLQVTAPSSLLHHMSYKVAFPSIPTLAFY